MIRRVHFWLFFGLIVFFPAMLGASPTSDYTKLKGFLQARMYTEAYYELLKCELGNRAEDPKLSKLKKDLLANTRKEAGGRAKVRPADPLILTVLADLDYQEGQLDKSIGNISKALNGDSGTLANYVFAKALFAKGNIPQAFDAMEKALQADPGSETVFEDFQFLYNCKNYGLASAKRLAAGTPGFLTRSSQIASKSGPPTPVDNPFENDPTTPPDIVTPPEPEPDPLITAQPPDKPVIPRPPLATDSSHPQKNPASTAVAVLPPDPQNASSGEEFPEDPIVPDKPVTPLVTVASAPVDKPSEDPEQKKIKEAEYLLQQAQRKFTDRALDDAETVLLKARALYPELIGADDLQKQIDEKKKVLKDFKLALSLYENGKYDLARDPIQKAYDENPDKYPEAPFYLGKIYLLGGQKDLKKARNFFDIYLKNPKADPDLRRDVEWVIIGILADDEQFIEAYRQFNDFLEREPEYAKNRETFWKLRYRLWYQNYRTEVLVGMGLFFGAFVIVFLLMILPHFNIWVRNPVERAQKAFAAKNYQKAAQITEDFLKTGTQPIQVQRQLLEISVEANYLLKNYFKCQDHAKQILTHFPDNLIAWSFLAKTYVETNDSSDEAITMYETLYKRNPENKQYLPILCRYYAQNKQYTVESLEIMLALFQKEPGNKDNALALAEGLVQTKRLGEEAIPVLTEALKHQPRNADFRELLARNYSKKGQFSEAVKECLQVLDTNISSMGIHVVYTTCMKKLNMLEEAVLQYEEFLKKHPAHPQLSEILTGLRRELEQTQGSALPANDGMSPFSDEIISDSLGPLSGETGGGSDIGLEGFVEPPPEGFNPDADAVPVPDFIKKAIGAASPATPPVTPAETPSSPPPGDTASDGIHDMATLDPFAEESPPAKSPPPEPVSAPTQAPTPVKRTPLRKVEEGPDLPPLKPKDPDAPPPKSRGSKLGKITIATKPPKPLPKPEPVVDELPPIVQPSRETAPKVATSSVSQDELSDARGKLAAKKFEDAIQLLAPKFATNRSRPLGVLLADAYLQNKQPSLAKEILDTLDVDQEMMGDDLKDILYRVAVTLEDERKFDQALQIYDTICNVDINYRDAFDRSDRLYSQHKKKK